MSSLVDVACTLTSRSDDDDEDDDDVFSTNFSISFNRNNYITNLMCNTAASIT
jgi:hypothetical protein